MKNEKNQVNSRLMAKQGRTQSYNGMPFNHCVKYQRDRSSDRPGEHYMKDTRQNTQWDSTDMQSVLPEQTVLGRSRGRGKQGDCFIDDALDLVVTAAQYLQCTEND